MKRCNDCMPYWSCDEEKRCEAGTQRLIDVTRLKCLIQETISEEEVGQLATAVLSQMCRVLDSCPTIEAEPVKHGMTHERLLLSIQTVKENLVILENVEPEDAGCYLQLELERHILELLEAEAEGRLVVLPRKMDLEGE